MARHMCETRVIEAADICRAVAHRPVIRIGQLDFTVFSAFDPDYEDINNITESGVYVNGSRSLVEARYVGADTGGLTLIMAWSSHFLEAARDNDLGYALGLAFQGAPRDRNDHRQFGRSAETLLREFDDADLALDVYNKSVRDVLAPHSGVDMTYSGCVTQVKGSTLIVGLHDLSNSRVYHVELEMQNGRFDEQHLISVYMNGPREGSNKHYRSLISQMRDGFDQSTSALITE
jgi:hypothetical protein